MIRVMLVDDHSIVRTGVKMMLHLTPDIKVVHESAVARAIVEDYAACLPDVVLLDIRMPGMDGLEALGKLRSAVPASRVIMLTTSHVEADMQEALELGACGYVMKDMQSEVIEQAIRAVMRGEVFLPDAVRLALEAKKSRQDLSPRQMDVLRFLAKGLLDKEIAERMKLSERTVSHYCGAIYQKLGAANRTEAVTLALKQGLVSADRG